MIMYTSTIIYTATRTYPAMQVQCAVIICPLLFAAIQDEWQLSDDFWLELTLALKTHREFDGAQISTSRT